MVIPINIPDAEVQRVSDAVCARQGYDPLKDGSKLAFCRKFLISLLMQEVKTYERDLRTKVAADAVPADPVIT